MKQPVTAADKSLLRQVMKDRRDRLDDTVRAQCSRRITELAMTYIRGLDAGSVMLYLSFRSEVRTDALIESLWSEGRAVIVPVSNPFDRSLTLYRLHDWEHLITGAYGIREPDPGLAEPCGPQFVPDLVLVPGLAFDAKGGRLGYGGGYYDRFREQMPARQSDSSADSLRAAAPLWIGLAYELQMIDEVPMQPHDAVIDGVITEQGIRLTSTLERG
ncbi:5-formyltetrahydrofolate cyclo-ligase [Paenibacillus sp. 1P07SE]|uniref:5-formyltetrahydrofolate cyclo-ligase n=1 Tax=Paenibacillus sp. 1P07SE TaxID=3132209 RepID=UPI0039A443CF